MKDDHPFSDFGKSEKPLVYKLHSCEKEKIIILLFKKNMVLPKHKTNVPAELLVLKGKIVFIQDGEEEVFQELDIKVIPVNVYHEVKAMEESHCLLIQNLEHDI